MRLIFGHQEDFSQLYFYEVYKISSASFIEVVGMLHFYLTIGFKIYRLVFHE